ncbi:hypothetical protein [Streptomyces sp. ISL-96]|nr:hypothetical protein [Streptomyces sp. ISL-96]
MDCVQRRLDARWNSRIVTPATAWTAGGAVIAAGRLGGRTSGR